MFTQDDLSVSQSSLMPRGLTVILVHGFLDHITKLYKDEFFISTFTQSPFVDNFIIVSWTELSGRLLFEPDFIPLYPIAVGNLPATRDRIASFMAWMILDWREKRCKGSWAVGRCQGLQQRRIPNFGANLKIRKWVSQNISALFVNNLYPSAFVGLDPAGPLFYPPHPEWNIAPSDAHFVDVYHSNAGLYGDITLDGHVDFISESDSIRNDLHSKKLGDSSYHVRHHMTLPPLVRPRHLLGDIISPLGVKVPPNGSNLSLRGDILPPHGGIYHHQVESYSHRPVIQR
ncbi:Lipase member H [Folsomia candida]|uniref:Lipase member H n=1 Tax=Folsomia candida TaxID=158441 RepID=A0A226E8L2_FOLCA|nr:Lipase member H [Folsomia candida]